MNKGDELFWLDAICSRFESDWVDSSQMPKLESYLAEVIDEQKAKLFRLLLPIDIEYRKKSSMEWEAAFYLDRFPQYADAINAVFLSGETVSMNGDIGRLSSTDFSVELPETIGHSASMPAADSPTIRPDAFRYEPEKLLGRGGFGQVWQAEDRELSRKVAYKEMRDDRENSEAARACFQEEALLTGQLEHPSVVPVYGFGWSSPENPYYAMRLVTGKTFKSAIRDFHIMRRQDDPHGAVAFLRLLKSFIQVCQAVHFAHDRSIAHTDIKPANIVLGDYGEAYLVDWGLAKRFSDESQQTNDNASKKRLPMAGTLHYMSPEQLLGEHLGPQWDIYSLGATLYELLTGSTLFAEINDSTVLIEAVRLGQFPLPSDRLRTVDRKLERICLKSLTRKPEDRFGSADELARELEKYVADLPLRQWRRAVKHFREVCADRPDQAEYQISLAKALQNLGTAHTGLKQFTQAEECLIEAERAFLQTATSESHRWVMRDLSAISYSLARIKAEQGQKQAALDHYREAQERLVKYLGDDGDRVDLVALLFEPSDVGFFRYIVGD